MATPKETLQKHSKLLEHSKLFALLDENGQERLFKVAEERTFEGGQSLMTEGSEGGAFYVLTKGSVKVLVDDLMGPKEVARLGQGSFVGEMAALLGEPRSATVVALEEVEALVFASQKVNAVLVDYPHVRDAIVKLALKRSEDTLQKMLEDE